MATIRLPDGNYFPVLDGESPTQAYAEAMKKYPQSFGITPRQNSTQAADLGTDLKRGILGIPGAITGLLDIPVAAVTGKPMVSQGWDEIGNITGFQPSKWRSEASKRYTPERQAQDAEIQAVHDDPDASGWAALGAHLANPMAGVVGTAVQSLPSMLAGGYGGAKVLGGIASKLTPAAGRALIAGGGEGAIAAGQFRNAQTEQGVGTPYEERIKSLGALGAGVVTGLLSGAGGALSSKIGITDPDAIFANAMAKSTNQKVIETLGAMTKPEIAAFRAAANRSIATRVGVGMVQEGLLEELPQSAQEKMWQNWVEDKPLMAGVQASAIQGGLSGALMGGAFNAHRGGAKKDLAAYDADNAAKLKRAEGQVALQTKLVQDAQNAAAAAFVESQPIEGVTSRQEAVGNALSGLLKTESGVQEVLKNVKNYFPGYSQEDTKTVKRDLLQLRDTLKADEKQNKVAQQQASRAKRQAELDEAKREVELTRSNRQAELDEAFNAMTPEEQAVFNEPSVMAKPEATAYTPEVLKKLGLHPKSLEFRNSVGKPIGDETAVAEITNFANRTGSATTRENITQHLDTIAQTKPVATPDQTTIAATQEKAAAGTATPAELQKLRDLQEKINGSQDAGASAAGGNQVPNDTGSQSGVGIDNVGGINAASSAGQVDAGTVGLPSLSARTDVGRAEPEREPLNVSQDNEYVQTRQAMLEYVNNPKPATKQDALVYAMMVQKLDKSSGGTTDKQAKATADKLLAVASEAERAKATRQYEKYRRADAPKTEEQLAIEQARQDKLARLAADRQAADLQGQQEEFAGQKYNDAVIAKDAEDIIADQDKAATTKKRQQQAIDDQTYHDTQRRAQQDQDIRDLMDEGVISELGDFGDAYDESKVEAVKTPSTVAEIKSAVSKFLNTKHWNTERLHIVQSVADVPANRRHAFNERTQAVAFTGKEAWLVADRIAQGNGKAVFLHEVGVHLGMKGLLGEGRAKNLATRISDMAKNGTVEEQAIARAAIGRVARAKETGNHEEMIAYFVEEAIKYLNTNPKSIPQRIKAWLKEFLVGASAVLKKLNTKPEAMSGDDIVMLAKGAAKVIMTSDTAVQNTNGEGFNRSESSVKDISDLAEAAADEYHVIERKLPPKVLDRMWQMFGKPPKVALSDWLLNGFIGTGESWRRKEQAHFGNYALVNGKESGYVSQQRATGMRNLVSGAMEFGKLVIDDMGVVKVQDSAANAKTLYAATNDIYAAMRADGAPETGKGSIYDMFYHMAYADRYAKAKENGFADTREFSLADVEAGKAYQHQYADQWNAWQDVHQEMRAQTMDFMVQSGAFTPEKAKLYLDRVEYIPFSREEQEALTTRGNNARGLLSGRTEYHIKGDSTQIRDPMVNIISNQEWLMQWGVKNNAANLLANSMTQMYADTGGALGGKWTKDSRPADNKVKIFVNGEAKYLTVLDPIDLAIFAGHPTLGMASMGIFHKMTGLLRKGVTLMPSFHFRQLIEDPLRATFISGNAPGYGKTAMSAWKHFGGNIDSPFGGAPRETAVANKLRHLGIVGQRDYQDTHDNFLKGLSGETIPKWRKALEYTESIAQANDLSTRAAVYEQAYKEAIAEGLSESAAENKASYKALMLINFNNRGNFATITALMNMVPFINARIQGDSRMYQALIGKNVTGLSREQASKMMLLRLSNLAAFTVLYSLARGGDDDYESAEQNTRDGNFLFNVGGVPLKFPVPPELGLVKTGVEQAIRQMSGNENSDERKVYQAVGNAFTHLVFGPSDFTPSMFKPLIENATNHSFFTGRELVGQDQQGLQTNMQKTPQTSAMAVAISDMLQNGPTPMQVSPIKIDNLIRGWLGTAGNAVLGVGDIMFGDKPSMTPNQLPGVGGMFYNPEGGGIKNDFYEMLETASKAKQTLTALQKNDTPEAVRAFIETNRSLLQMYPKLNSIKAQLDAQRAQYNRALQSIKLGSRSPEDVADLKSKIYETELRILKGVPKLREQMGH